MAVSFCVLLWAYPGQSEALAKYEDAVLEFVPEHGGRVMYRVRSTGSDGQPDEVQLFEFVTSDGVDSYMADPRRLALGFERTAAVERTEIRYFV